MARSKYYSLNRLWSYNGYVNFVMSGRGQGKSFSAKNQIIKNYLKDKSQAVYVRRTKTELDEIKDTYWNDIKKFYPDLTLTVEGYIGYIDGDIVLYFIPLSTSTNKKSASYPDVVLIVFDEYIITKTTHNRYLRNEITLLFDLLETCGRDRDNIKILILSNAVSFVNPFFSFFDIVPNTDKRFQKYKDGLIILEMFNSVEFVEDKKKTKFARLIKGTTYEAYCLGNETLEDTDDFIKERGEGDWRFLCSFKTDGLEVGCWLNNNNLDIFLDEKIDTSCKDRYVVQTLDTEENYLHVKQYRTTSWRIKQIKKNFNEGKVFFATQEIKKHFLDKIIKFL